MYIVIGRRKLVVMCAAVLAAGAICGSVLKMVPSRKTFGGRESITVVVDAGHGLPDGGAVGAGGSVEADINLKIADKLCEVLEGKGIDVIMTRTDRRGLCSGENEWSKVEDMRLRREIMKKSGAELFVSVHMNHFTDSSVHGLRLFYAANHPEMKQLCELMQQKMSEVTGAKINAVRAADKGLFLMKAPPIPAVLVECGFISNPDEEKRLLTDEYASKIAWAMADSIEKCHFGGIC